MNTKQKGDIAEAHVLAAFLKAGLNVLIPFGDRSRYDCVIEADGCFKRIQVKTGRLESSSIEFNAYSVTTRNGRIAHMPYTGQADAFAVYCPPLDKLYLVPVEKCQKFGTRLSLSGKSRNQFKPLVAADFEWPVSSRTERPLDKRLTTV